MNLPPALTKKLGPFPVWAWGVAVTGGIVLGLYLRHRAKSSSTQSTDPNAGLDALNGYSGFGVADPNAGMDSAGVISGLMQQNGDLLSLLLAGAGGGDSVPATTAPDAPVGPAATPPAQVAVSSFGASPTAAPTTVDNTPQPAFAMAAMAPADPSFPDSFFASPGIIDTGTQTSTGLPIQETTALAQGAPFQSAATSSTGGIGGTGYLLLSDKTLRPTPGVNVMM
jgi:hypothetical protein